MPLIQGKSKKSFDKNLKTEISHGKPMDQALAISYDIKRRNAKKMAEGGMATIDHPMEAHKSMFEVLMERRRKRMAEGGEIDLKLNSMEQPNEYYHLNEDEVLEENYGSEYEDLHQPEDSNLTADPDEKPSIIHQIRQKRLMRSK